MKYIDSLFHFLLQKLSRDKNPYVYVAIGDSAAEGVGASTPERAYTGILFNTIKKHKKHAEYHNFGKNGAPVQEIIVTQLDKAIKLKPDLVTISVGANDLRVRTVPRTFKKRLSYLISRLKTETSAQIVINTVPDFSHTPKIPRYLKFVSRFAIRHFNGLITSIAKKQGVIVVDLFEQGTYYSTHFPEAIADDGFHPSDIGYALWANAMLLFMNPLLTSRKT